MASFKQMRKDGVLKRADSEYIEYHNIHIEPGFNPTGRTEEEDEDDEELFQFIMDGKFDQLPAWEVRPREDGGVWIVDCHRRHKQTGRALAAGAPLADPKTGKVWIPIVQFVGNDVDRVIRLATSNKKKGLKPQQFAEVCKRLRGFNMTAADVAKALCCSRPKVDQALILADANHDVQEAVKTGDISATEAIKQVRKHGDGAGKVIKEAVKTAKSEGKKKATAKTIAPKAKGPDGNLTLAPDSPINRLIAVSKTLKAVHTALLPYTLDGSNMHIDDIMVLFGQVEATLHEGKKK